MQEAGETPPGSLRLLPQYDCYLLGCGPRERIVPEAARPRVNTYGRGASRAQPGYQCCSSMALSPEYGSGAHQGASRQRQASCGWKCSAN